METKEKRGGSTQRGGQQPQRSRESAAGRDGAESTRRSRADSGADGRRAPARKPQESSRRNGTSKRPQSTASRTKSGAQRPEKASRRTEAGDSRTRRTAQPQDTRRAEDRRTRMEQTARAQAQTRPRTGRKKKPTPKIVYTPPRPLSQGRLLLRLVTVAAVVIALVLGVSIFFKVEVVTVSGAEKYTAWEVREASGIQNGENLLAFGRTRAVARILAELPYVKTAQIGIKLPDTVNIVITESEVAYAFKDQSGFWWLVNADGKVLEQTDTATAGQHPQISGVLLSVPAVNEQARAANTQAPAPTEPAQTEITGVTMPVTVTDAERLDTVLTIAQYLEANGMIGKIASIDVTDMAGITLWYGQRFEIRLGDTTQLSYKLSMVASAITQQLGEFDAGVLDASFTTWPDGIGYTPFS